MCGWKGASPSGTCHCELGKAAIRLNRRTRAAQHNRHMRVSCPQNKHRHERKHRNGLLPVHFCIFADTEHKKGSDVRARQLSLLLRSSRIPLFCIRDAPPPSSSSSLPHTHPTTHVISLDMPLKVAQ